MKSKLALEGGNPVRKEFLPFALPSIGDEEINEVKSTMLSGWLTTGPQTKKFEEKFSEYTGSDYAVAVNSCTAALHLALKALQVGPGDEVITTPLTFASTANIILMSGAKPVFVDIDAETFNIDPEKIERAISKRTKVLLPVHYGGYPAELDTIMKLAERYNLHVVEDAAHAAGARYGDKMIGNVSTATCFSFYATKTITTGEGGMLTTNSRTLADKVRMLSLHGLSKDAWNRYSKKGSWYYEIVDLGYKYNMTDVQASIGLPQLRKINEFTKKRREIARLYDESLKDIPEIKLPPRDHDKTEHIYHLYTIRLDLDQISFDRDTFIEALRAENIGTSVHFIPIHLHPFYRKEYGFIRGDFPATEIVFDSIVSLPIYPRMTVEDVNDVVTAVKKIVSSLN